MTIKIKFYVYLKGISIGYENLERIFKRIYEDSRGTRRP
jgi:hypothetical protein